MTSSLPKNFLPINATIAISLIEIFREDSGSRASNKFSIRFIEIRCQNDGDYFIMNREIFSNICNIFFLFVALR